MAQPSNNYRAPALDLTRNNVEAIARLEEEALHGRSLGERISGAIIGFIGTTTVVIVHLIVFAAWVLVNLNLVPGVAPFDPFPFGILALIVSGECVLLAIFILINQNYMTRQADRRAHLDLQISLLAEQELTMILRMQQSLCHHFGLDVEHVREEVQQLTRKTDVQQLVNELEDKLPG
ncbi:MAG TPA: DUF1003 domain-containing protein [Blastocatellia bacterium]|nr:DUF1003 domain-containing protein [Blastocatellia bacterium]